MDKATADVSVVIPAYGECRHLPQIVVAILAQSPAPKKILVVHSGSGDPSQQLQELDGRVHVIHRNCRTWASIARNIGLSESATKWVAFVDADVLPQAGWLSHLLECTGEHDDRFIVGSVGFASSGGYWGLCRWMIECSSIHPYLPDRAMQGGGSGNMLASVSAMRQVGGFPEDLPASEDVVLFARLRKAGLKNWFCAKAEGRHFNIPGFSHFATHLWWLGRWGAIARRMNHIPGSATIRYPVLAPFLWTVRYLLIGHRVLRWGRAHRFAFFYLTPGILLGSIIWNGGFLCGLATSEAAVAARERTFGRTELP